MTNRRAPVKRLSSTTEITGPVVDVDERSEHASFSGDRAAIRYGCRRLFEPLTRPLRAPPYIENSDYRHNVTVELIVDGKRKSLG